MNTSTVKSTRRPVQPIAIVGMSCIFPGAPSLDQFWQNIVGGIDSIREVSSSEWDATTYRNKSSFGKIYCSRGGFITEYADFNPLEFGIMPSSLRGADPDQFISLRVAAEALRDAGYHHKSFDGERAEIILGRTMAPGAGSLNLIQHGQTVDQVTEILTAVCPQLREDQLELIAQRLKDGLKPCNADTIPAVMPNVLSGRIANKLGFRGRNLILDAACASSLIAVEEAINRLLAGHADLAIAGGVHINSHPYFYQMFCELGALSSSGTIRPFDDNADGTILGEGVGMVVLKRLDDALRDENRIYAVIRGIGSSSDGRGGGTLAPNIAGEALAMRRAYDMAGVSPRTVELLEAHGTGTRLGDFVEMKAVQQVFCDESQDARSDAGTKPWCAIGSVKSMIGHTQAASGVAGLIKAALALYHRVLPPTLNVGTPNTQFDWNKSPCYINNSQRTWNTEGEAIERATPRRAAVSAFGFGGVNAHAILEEFHFVETTPSTALVQTSPGGMVKLALDYPSLSSRSLNGLQFESDELENESLDDTSADDCRNNTSFKPSTEDNIVHSYIQNMGAFQQNLLNVQENVMLSYLNDSE